MRRCPPPSSPPAGRVVTIELSSPLRPPPPVGLYALAVGLLLALHTPAWILLLQYRPDSGGDGGNYSSNSFLGWLLRSASYMILEWTPWLAGSLLCFFLAGLFMYVGLAKMNGKMP
jgi:hypothetical protein